MISVGRYVGIYAGRSWDGYIDIIAEDPFFFAPNQQLRCRYLPTKFKKVQYNEYEPKAQEKSNLSPA